VLGSLVFVGLEIGGAGDFKLSFFPPDSLDSAGSASVNQYLLNLCELPSSPSIRLFSRPKRLYQWGLKISTEAGNKVDSIIVEFIPDSPTWRISLPRFKAPRKIRDLHHLRASALGTCQLANAANEHAGFSPELNSGCMMVFKRPPFPIEKGL
jgi:hypothetical protein